MKAWLACLALLWIPVSFVQSSDNMFAWFGSAEHAREVEFRQRVRLGGPEYLPRWSGASEDDLLHRPIADAEVVAGEGRVAVRKSGRKIFVSADMHGAGLIALPSFYYPGWAVEGAPPDAPVGIADPDALGRLVLRVPPGQSDSVVVLKRSTAEIWGLRLSALVLVCLGLVSLSRFWTAAPRRRP